MCERSPHNWRYQAQKNSCASTRSNLHCWLIKTISNFFLQQDIKKIRDNQIKRSEIIYDLIDRAAFLKNFVPKAFRSNSHITFKVQESFKVEFEKFFVEQKCVGYLSHRAYQADYRLSFYPMLANQLNDDFVEKFEEKIEFLKRLSEQSTKSRSML